MDNLILCSTGAFIHNWNGLDHTLIQKLNPRLSYPGFELFMFDRYADRPEEYARVAETVDSAAADGVMFYSMHMNKIIGKLISRDGDGDLESAVRIFTSNCEYAVRYGVRLLVLHLWGGPPSDKNIGANMAAFPILKKISDRHGLILTVENIVCNTHRPLGHMKKLWQLYPNDAKFTMYVRQAEFHKSLAETCDSSFLWDNGLVSHLHVNDFEGGHMDWERLRVNVPLGRGDVDFGYFFPFLKSIGFGGSVAVESGYGSETGFDGIVRDLNESYEFIKNGLRQKCRRSNTK